MDSTANLPANVDGVPFYHNGYFYSFARWRSNDGFQESFSIVKLNTKGVVETKYPLSIFPKRIIGVDENNVYILEEDVFAHVCNIIELSPTNSIRQTYKNSEQLSEFMYLGSSIFLAKSNVDWNVEPSNLDVYELISIKTREFKKIKFQLDDNLVYLQRYGFLVKGNKGINFKVCLEAGKFFAFDDSLKIIYEASTVVKYSYPDLIKRGRGQIDHSKPTVINNCATVIGNHIVIVSSTSINNREWFADFYDQKSGQYRWSFPLPLVENYPAFAIFGITNNQLALSYRNGKINYITLPDSLLL